MWRRRDPEKDRAGVPARRYGHQEISVEVEGSKVVLKGTVRSWAEKEEVERAAWSAPGITSVDSRITVSPLGLY